MVLTHPNRDRYRPTLTDRRRGNQSALGAAGNGRTYATHVGATCQRETLASATGEILVARYSGAQAAEIDE